MLALMSDRRKTAAVVYDERLVFGYAGGMFKADGQTIATARTLTEMSNVLIMIDINKNPIQIEDPQDFMRELVGVYNEASMAYHHAIEEINRLRSKEGITNV